MKYTQQRVLARCDVLLDIAKPVALLLLILSLYAAFHAAFLIPSAELQDRIYNALVLLALSGGISVSGGLLFRESLPEKGVAVSLAATLPVRLYCWSAVAMAVLFGLSWYVESYSSLHPNVRY